MTTLTALLPLLVIAGSIAAPSVLAQGTADCRRFGFARICGTAAHAKEFADLLDFHMERKRGHDAVIAEITKVHSNARLRQLPYDHALSRRWQSLATKFGGKRSLNKLDPLAMELAKGDPFIAAMLEAFKREEIFLSIDLAGYPNFLTIHRDPLARFCNRFLDSPDAAKTYSPSMRRRGMDECETEATGNVVNFNPRDARDEEPLRLLYFTYLTAWGMELVADKQWQHMKATPRAVYLIGDGVPASPRVTKFGDLYLPEKLATTGDPLDLDLVLLHEALHLRYGGWVATSQVLFSQVPKIFKAEPIAQTQFEQLMAALLRHQAAQEEFSVDAAVVVELYDRPRERLRYADLIKRLETLYTERAEAIGLMNELAATSQSPDVIHALTAALAEGGKAPRGFTARQAEIYRRWLDAYQRYMSSAMTRFSQEFPDRMRQEPNKVERELTVMMRKLLADYAKLTKDQRRTGIQFKF